MKSVLVACLFLLASADRTQFRGVKDLAEFSRKHDAILLLYFNNENIFRIVSGGKVRELSVQNKLSSREACCPHRATPSLSSDGKELAYVRLISAAPREEALAVWNLENDASANVFRAETIWAASWSRDARRLAVIADQKESPFHQLTIVDRDSGGAQPIVIRTLNVAGVLAKVSNAAAPSWSPDNSKLAIELYTDSQPGPGGKSVVAVLDLQAGSAHNIADGFAPSWSPSGQIAFFDESRRRCLVVAFEGSRPELLFNAPRGFLIPGKGAPLFFRTVWSPDGKHLLFHQWVDADLVTDVFDFDLVKKKALRIATSELQVVDWSSVSPDQGSR